MAPSPSNAATTSVQVALRIRPQTHQDTVSIPTRFQRPVIHATSPSAVTVETSSAASSSANPTAIAPASGAAAKKQVFAFDQVHAPVTTQHELFTSTAKPLVSRFIEGFNCTILAYGQTSSGKTFTMTGVDLDADPNDPKNGMGIIPRAVSTIFSEAKHLKGERGNGWNFSVKGSFIEIYNEDLIDLLSMEDGSGGKREVQIREDKNGHIIWGGLREVAVKNTSDVMSLIRQGTSIRRTNETDMNAQSSRSHAIFSLTLTQKKYTGSGAPPRSASPQPPNGRSPSRLARPGSTYVSNSSNTSRMASPTFGRPATPSFATAMGRGGGLRPASSLGIHGEGRQSVDDDAGEWVTIVSKFHFVDLAGSERLKRTAAAGERIKEGISINSGLLALGNVISALGDPSRAKSTTHIPYRDSKLTRLLQDSLGGNTHTLMIACVSSAEYNVGETINTLKYANRARNIKNRAVLNEKEDGWDDVEWLQGTVTRLRKDLKVLKDGGAIPSNVTGAAQRPDVTSEGASKKVLMQLTDLQNNYESLREKFVERTEELTRLRQELGEKHRTSSSGAIGGSGKYEEIVGPVIEEYEKTIEAMEAELNLNRAALRHTNEMVEEKEEELSVLTERHSATELYLDELKTRLAKVQEREASTEAYIRDLEEKMKTYDETSISSSESMTDLKREVMKYKDAESHSTTYIADLEARLAKADESVLSLQQTTERLEKECERRRIEVEILQTRLETLKQDGESWRLDLDQREKKVQALEKKMEEWERKKVDAGEARERLHNVADEVVQARRSLQVNVSPLEDSGSIGQPSPTGNDGELGSTTSEDTSLNQQFIVLQQTHTATLADLSSVTAKYRDALREISDLASQIQEAKLSQQQAPDTPSEEKQLDIPPHRRRPPGSRNREISEPQLTPQGRRLFFRQAASSESLHSRSLSQSQSLSQELSLARSRKTSFSSHGTSSSISHSPLTSNSPPLSSLRPDLSISLPGPSSSGLQIGSAERSAISLEKEIMRLQEVLKEREAEISVLEKSLNASSGGGHNGNAFASEHQNGDANVMNDASQNDSPQGSLTPATTHRFDDIRKHMENGCKSVENGTEKSGSVSETDESLDRLNELMLSMAQKESQHREIVEDLNVQLAQVRRQYDDLTTLSRDQASNMSAEIEALQRKYSSDLATLEELKEREALLTNALEKAEASHSAAMETAQRAHIASLAAKDNESERVLADTEKEYISAVDALKVELQNATASASSSRQVHEDSLAKLKTDQDEALRVNAKEAQAALERAQSEHKFTLSQMQADHEEEMKRKESDFSLTLQTTEEEYYNALTKLRSDHASKLEKQLSEHSAVLERLRQEHNAELKMREIAQEGLISESQSSRTLAITELQDEHSAAISRKEAAFNEELDQIQAEHRQALVTKEEDFKLLQDKTRAENERIIMQLKEEQRVELESTRSALAAKEMELSQLGVKFQVESDMALQELRVQHAEILRASESTHDQVVAQLKDQHSNILTVVQSREEADRRSLIQAHADEIKELKATLATTTADITAAQELHRLALEQGRAETDNLTAEKERLTSALADLGRNHLEERNKLQKEHDLLIQELESRKAAAQEFVLFKTETHSKHETAMLQKDGQLNELEGQLRTVQNEREDLEAEVAQLRAELDKTRSEQSKLIQEASNRDSLVNELEKHRSVIADMQDNLQKVKDQKDTLQSEKTKQESLVKDLQAQLARGPSPPLAGARNLSLATDRGFRPGVSAAKLPPPTPPPSVPPPPAPRSAYVDTNVSTSSQSSTASSRESQPESVASSATSIGPTSVNGQIVVDPKLAIRIEQQAKQIEEQEAMIKTLNKQLTHCETDLQTHMDIVSTLETSLGDSEKNLRKARMQATELARERDTLTSKLTALQAELEEARREVVSVRRSVVEEKQSLEQRLDEERRAKERARAQLDTRMEELTKRKSKFACL